MRTLLSMAIGIGAGLAVDVSIGAESPNDYAMAMPLTAIGAHSHFEFAVPAEVYEGVVHADGIVTAHAGGGSTQDSRSGPGERVR